MPFGDRLKEIREELGYTQKEMANKCGIGYTTLQRYEKGSEFPAGTLFLKIAELGYNLDWLITGGSVKKNADCIPRPKEEEVQPDTKAISLTERREQRLQENELPINEQLIIVNEWLAQLPIIERLDFLNDLRACFADFDMFWQKKTGREDRDKIAAREDITA